MICIANTDWYLKNFQTDLIQALRRNGLNFELLSIQNSRFQNKILWLIILLFKVITCRSPILSFTTSANFLILFINYFYRKKCIVNVSGLGRIKTHRKNKVLYAFYLSIYIRLLRKADHIVVQNPVDYRFLKRKRKQKIHLIRGSGFNETFYNIPRDYNNREKRIAFIGRPLQEKGYNLFLEAKRNLIHSSKLEFITCVKNDFVTENMFEQKSGSLEANYENIVNVGDFLREIDFLFFCSSYGEGTPKIILEALACGCIVVARRSVDLHGLLINNKNALLFDSDNDLMEILKNLSSYTELKLRRLSDYCAASALEFGSDKKITNYIDMISKEKW